MTAIDPLSDIDMDAAPLPRTMNVTQIAAHVGRPRSYVTATLKGAGMRKTEGRYLTAKALEVLAALADPATSLGKATMGHGKLAEGATMDSRVASYAEARAKSEALRAEKLQQALDREAGNLIAKADVIALARRIATAAREAVLAVPAKIAANCAGKEPEAIQRLMADALGEALRGLSGDFLLPEATK